MSRKHPRGACKQYRDDEADGDEERPSKKCAKYVPQGGARAAAKGSESISSRATAKGNGSSTSISENIEPTVDGKERNLQN